MTLMILNQSIANIFPDWRETNEFPSGLKTTQRSGSTQIVSRVWDGEGIRRARLCQLSVPDKFYAETLVIYPDEMTDAPIFGCEYLRIGGKKYFGAIDFHPLSQAEEYLREYIDNYLGDFPDTSAEVSKFYDLDCYFSKKFWFEKRGYDFYNYFYSSVEEYLIRYRDLLCKAKPTHSVIGLHKKYDLHMGENDPAHGILKAYFSKEFADFYIREFLFNLMGEDL